MFLLKKFVSAFLLPVPIGLFLLFLAFIFLLMNSYKKAKVFGFLSLLWFALLSNQTVSNAILFPLENAHKALLQTPKVNYILVLGHAHKSDENQSITSQLKSTAVNRMIEAIKHYKNLQNAKLIVSGYSGFDKNPHALMQEKLAITLGVKKEDILRMDTPNDTHAEAVQSKNIVQSKPFILVTSASHMKRSMLLFKKEGLKPIAAPTQNLAYEDKSYQEIFSAQNLRKVEVAIHEYLGILWAYLRDKI